MKDKKMLIGEYMPEIDSGETTYDDFVSRRDFINRTGIYISTAYFAQLYEDFKKSGVPVDEFVSNYESKYATCVREIPLSGTFKYELADSNANPMGIYLEQDPDEANIYERFNALDMDVFYYYQTMTKVLDEANAMIKDLMKRLAKYDPKMAEVISSGKLKSQK